MIKKQQKPENTLIKKTKKEVRDLPKSKHESKITLEARNKAIMELSDVMIKHNIKLNKKQLNGLESTLKNDLLIEVIPKYFLKRKFKDYFKRRKLRKKTDQTFLISMKYNNGTYKEFLLTTTDRFFTHGKKMYYIYYEEGWFSINHQMYVLEYQENFCVPINREINIKKSGKINKDMDEAEIYNAVSPEALKDVINMEYVKALTQDAEVTKWIKMAVVLIALNMLVTGILAFQIYQMSKPVPVV